MEIGMLVPILLYEHMAVWWGGKKREEGRQACAWAWWGHLSVGSSRVGNLSFSLSVPVSSHSFVVHSFSSVWKWGKGLQGSLVVLIPTFMVCGHFSASFLPLSCPALCFSPRIRIKAFLLEKCCPASATASSSSPQSMETSSSHHLLGFYTRPLEFALFRWRGALRKWSGLAGLYWS